MFADIYLAVQPPPSIFHPTPRHLPEDDTKVTPPIYVLLSIIPRTAIHGLLLDFFLVFYVVVAVVVVFYMITILFEWVPSV